MSKSEALQSGQVIRAQSGFYTVRTGQGDVVAVLKGRMKKDRSATGLVALGDFVQIRQLELPEGESGLVEAVIEEILPRRSALARRAPGPRGVWAQNIVVANVDLLVPVFAAALPEPHFGMLDRFLALAEIDEIDSLILLNKIDLGVSAEIEAQLRDYERIGYPVIRLSTKTGEGVEALGKALAGRVSAVVGPSGVGKSSLLNAIEPGLGLRVSAVSESVMKGRHTTRVGELHALAGGGLVADTPGLRELGVWDLDPGELEWAFVEFVPFLNTCRFYDCTHLHEPGCAVRGAIDSGAISRRRFNSYVRMLADEERPSGRN